MSALLPYQQRWVEDPAQVRVIEKSRRIGISWATAAEAVLTASAEGGNDVWYVGYNRDMAAEFIRDCAHWVEVVRAHAAEVEEELMLDEGKEILTYAIRFPSGHRITALSSRPTNLRGKKGHIVIDEAAHHDDLPGLLKAALATLMWGGRVSIISTHDGVDNYFNELVNDTRAGRRPYSLHRVTLDDALDQGLFKRIAEVLDKEWSPDLEAEWRDALFLTYGSDADEELLCIPARSGGTYLPRILVEERMSEDGTVVRLTLDDDFTMWPEAKRRGHVEAWCDESLAPLLEALPKDKLHFLGEDFGRLSDRTVIAVGYLDQRLVRCFPFSVELANVPFESQKQVIFYVLDRLPRLQSAALDATGNGAYLAEVCAQRYGASRVQQVKLTEPWYAEQLPPFKAAFEDGVISLPRDADHLVDLAAFKVVNGLPRLPKARLRSTTGAPRHGDAGIAYLLGYFASRQEVRMYEYTPAPRRHSAHNLSGGLVDSDDAAARTTGWKRATGGLL